MTLELHDLEHLYVAVHEHQYGATLYLFRWKDTGPPLADESGAVWLAQQLKMDFEPQREEHISCFPLSDINNLNNIPTLSAVSLDPEEEP
jgi:hypothetical protein